MRNSLVAALVVSVGLSAAMGQPVGMQTDRGAAAAFERCLPPCDCVGNVNRAIADGGYSRWFSATDGEFRVYQITGVLLTLDFGARNETVEAHGEYVIGGDSPQLHRMTLVAEINGVAWRFDSGLVPHSGRAFPAIDIAMLSEQHGCTRYGINLVSSPSCRADFNEDGFVDGFDYDDFVSCFEGDRCPRFMNPDFTGDGFVDGFDYDAFVRAFEEGCR